MVSNLPFGSGVLACFPPQAHQARVSALSGRDMIPIRPVIREPLAEEPAHGPGFPLPFGRRHSLLGPSCARWGVEPSSRPADRQARPAGPQRGCHVPLGRGATGVGAAWTPGTVVRSRPVVGHRPAPAAFQRRSLLSRPCIPPAGVHLTRRHRRFTCVHPSGLSLACAPRTELGALGLSPGFAPCSYPQRTPGRGRSLRTGPGATSPTSADLPSTSATHHMRPRVAPPCSARSSRSA